eukprot:6200698-Pleurochrysis_carterae.AAC.2
MAIGELRPSVDGLTSAEHLAAYVVSQYLGRLVWRSVYRHPRHVNLKSTTVTCRGKCMALASSNPGPMERPGHAEQHHKKRAFAFYVQRAEVRGVPGRRDMSALDVLSEAFGLDSEQLISAHESGRATLALLAALVGARDDEAGGQASLAPRSVGMVTALLTVVSRLA